MYFQPVAGSVAFTGRNGTSYTLTGGPVDIPPSDIGLAFLNGWGQMSVTQFPGQNDLPQLGVSVSLGGISQLKLCQTAIPFVLASSGTMGNNGAISGLTALPATYSNGCYIYLPTNAIVAGSTAGWYYAVMSSATAGTVYNNPYTANTQPYIPATPTPFVTTGPGAFTGVSTATQGPSFTLPAGQMGPNGVLELAAVFGCAGTTSSKTVAVTLGSATIYSQSTTTAANVSALALLTCQNQGLVNAQVSNQTGALGFSATGQTYSSQNTANALTLALTATKVAADFVVFDSFSATVTPG